MIGSGTIVVMSSPTREALEESSILQLSFLLGCTFFVYNTIKAIRLILKLIEETGL